MNAQTANLAGKGLSANPNWWRGGVIYQIYPRSFQDSNGDGIGDLKGITSRLPYIASLGVDAIWISPFFTSPMKDFGYDVSDYCDVDPMFGTLADFDQLLIEAHKLGVRVMIDLVLSHTSDQHPWFAESRVNRTNPKSDWYVWADPKADGTAPNNWLSIFGGSAWQWDPRREQYYLHNFLMSQPDLNFHCEDVQIALLAATRFWLDRGVDGFRLDTINFYIHDKKLRDNPPLAKEERNATIAPSVNPYNHQRHVYSKNQPENLEFLKRFRALLNEYEDRACVGEVGDAQLGLEIMGEYTEGNDKAHMCYAFELLEGKRLTASRVVEVFDRVARVAKDGWACWAYSNHDVQRHVSRWGLSDEAARLMATLIVCLRGSVCIYQGEELGLPEADVPFEALQDPYGIEFWPEFKGRDGCRTPMVWDSKSENAGFGTGSTWLPISAAQAKMAADTQIGVTASMLSHYQAVIAMRHAHSVLADGDLEAMQAEGDLLTFTRKTADQEIFCAFNMSGDPTTATLPAGEWTSIGDGVGGIAVSGERVNLNGWQMCIAKRTGN
jgi:alpha-glucosidase